MVFPFVTAGLAIPPVLPGGAGDRDEELDA